MADQQVVPQQEVLTVETQPEGVQSEDDDSEQAGFKVIAKNDAFPIHANILDSEADMDEEKPGGIFSKKLYAEEGAGGMQTDSSADKDSDEEDFMGTTKNGGVDAKFNGFCRTNTAYRAHYKIARMK